LTLSVIEPAAVTRYGVTIGGFPASPLKYPVLVWLIMTAYAPRTTSLPSAVGFQMTPRRGWKSLPFLVTWVNPFEPNWISDRVAGSNSTSLLSASVGDGR